MGRPRRDGGGPFVQLVSQMRVRRWTLGITQRRLAQMVGVSQSVISEWETGAVVPTDESLDRWVEALGGELIIEVKWGWETDEADPLAS